MQMKDLLWWWKCAHQMKFAKVDIALEQMLLVFHWINAMKLEFAIQALEIVLNQTQWCENHAIIWTFALSMGYLQHWNMYWIDLYVCNETVDECHNDAICDSITGLCYASPKSDGYIAMIKMPALRRTFAKVGNCTQTNPIFALPKMIAILLDNVIHLLESAPILFGTDGYSSNDNNSCSYDDICFQGNCNGTA